jgi:hypothetical protein
MRKREPNPDSQNGRLLKALRKAGRPWVSLYQLPTHVRGRRVGDRLCLVRRAWDLKRLYGFDIISRRKRGSRIAEYRLRQAGDAACAGGGSR